MTSTELTKEDRELLLGLARSAIEHFLKTGRVMEANLEDYPPELRENGATFVTLTKRSGELRGCIGTLEAHEPLVQDVIDHAIAAARDDWRFPPVSPAELPNLLIEVSRLTPPVKLEYASPEELPAKLRPGVDGVILYNGSHRATFLPQVWDKLPDPAAFLTYLCDKMGEPGNLWRRKTLDVFTYQVEEFHEE